MCKRLLVAGAVVLGLLVQAPQASADTLTTIAYEGFDYPTGSLTGRNGGSGWSGAWTGGSPLGVNSTGLTYPGLTTVGGTSSYLTFLNSSNERCLTDSLDSGIIYFQFLSQFSANHGGGTPNIRLSVGGVGTGAFGNNNIPGNNNMSVLDSGLNSVAASSTPIFPNLTFTIVRIDHSSDSTQIWVNPNLATFDYASPPTADATALGFSPAIECILPITRNAGRFDEISILRFTPGGTSGGSSSTSVEATRTLKLSDVDGKCQSAPSITGSNSTWVQLPSSGQCTDPGRVLLGWSTSPQFPSAVAQAQIDKGWGAIDGDIDGTRMIFIPAGGFTFLTGDNTLYPVWSG